MSKKRRTVSLEEKVDAYLSQDGRNASELVNKLVKKHMSGGATEDEILDFRIEQVESEVNDLAGSLERKQNELSELKQRKEQHRTEKETQQEEQIQKAAQALRVDELNTTGPYIATDEDVIKQEAEKVGCTVQELKDEAIRQYNE